MSAVHEMVMLYVMKKHFELMQMDNSIPEKTLIMVFDFKKLKLLK